MRPSPVRRKNRANRSQNGRAFGCALRVTDDRRRTIMKGEGLFGLRVRESRMTKARRRRKIGSKKRRERRKRRQHK